MASDTAPPAVPAPHNPPPPPAHAPTTGQQAPRGLAGLLAAVEPARPAFNLAPGDPAHADAAYDPAAGGGASSSDFNHDPTTQATDASGKNSTTGQQQGVLRTWMLALAKRHEQAGAARLKALDIRKAQATALQVKEQRTTNRSEKIVGGTTGTNNSTNTSASKGDHKNHKNHDTKNNHSNQSGRAGAGGGSGPSGGRGSSGGHGSSGAGRGNSGTGGTGGRGNGTNHTGSGGKGTGKTDTPKTNSSGTGGTGSGGKSGASGKDGSTGKPGKDGKTTNSSGSGSGGVGGGSGKDTKPKTTTSTCGDSSGLDWTKKPSKDKPKHTAPNGGKGGQGSAGNPAATPPAGPTGAPGPSGKTPTPGNGGTPVDMRNTPDPKTSGKEQPKQAPDAKNTPQPTTLAGKDRKKPTTPTTGRVVIDTQPAREAGYDAGTRIGGIEAQLGALRDGIRDGRADVKEAASREKQRLDKAHADWKQQPPPQTPAQKVPPKPPHPPKPVAPPSTNDTAPGTDIPPVSLTKQPAPPHTGTHPAPKDPPMTTPTTQAAPAEPVKVLNTTATGLTLEGAARTTISRGEVRTLKQYERALTHKATTMGRAADGTKQIEAHADEQAKQAAHYLEAAKTVEGGENLLATLTRLQEAANAQAQEARLIRQNAIRAADACTALQANVATRYSGMYQAVINSDIKTPAEMAFYEDGDGNA